MEKKETMKLDLCVIEAINQMKQLVCEGLE